MLTVCCSMPFVMPPTGNAKGSDEGPVCDGGWAPSNGGLNWLPGCEWWYAWSNCFSFNITNDY